MLTALRWALLIGAVFNLLSGTVLFNRVGAPLARAWWSRFASPERGVPAWLVDSRSIRIWALVSGLGTLALWWYLGTPAGAALVEELFRQARGAA